MKKRFFACALLVLCLSVVTEGTLAYFTAEDVAHNVITSGGVDIAIREWQDPDGDGTWEPYPEEPQSVMPGSVLSKIVTVVNEDAESYIRAKFVVTVTDAAGETMELDAAAKAKLVRLNVQDFQVPVWKQLLYRREKWLSLPMRAMIDHMAKIRLLEQ